MASLEKPRKIEETVGKMRKLQEGSSWKTVGKRRKRFEKKVWNGGKAKLWKIRNIEANILKKLRIQSSTESSVRWGSEQDGFASGWGKSFWVKSSWVKSIWVKSIWGKSLWVRSIWLTRLWVKSIWVKSMCKKSFWVSLWVKSVKSL